MTSQLSQVPLVIPGLPSVAPAILTVCFCAKCRVCVPQGCWAHVPLSKLCFALPHLEWRLPEVLPLHSCWGRAPMWPTAQPCHFLF